MIKKRSRAVASQIRDMAEAKLGNLPPQRPSAQTVEELLHELEVHRIELEMQNDELRRTQLRLEESRNRFLDLFDFAPLGYFTLTRESTISAVNLTAAALLGEDRAKLRRRRFAELIALEDENRWQRFFINALQDKHRQSCELAMQRPGGSRLDVRLDCVREDGDPVMLRVAMTDITESKRTQTEVRKLSLAVERSPSSIVITDVDGSIEYVNPAFTRSSGYTAAEVLGKNPRLLKSGRTPAKTYDDLWGTIRSGSIWRGEFINRRKDGTEYFESAVISPLLQGNGLVAHFVEVKEDTTQRRQAAEELEMSEARLRLAKTAAGFGLFDTDLLSDSHVWDERVCEIWGVAIDQPIRYSTFIGGVHPDDRAQTQAAVDRALNPTGNGEYRAEYRVVNCLDSRVRHVAANGQAIFENGRAVRLIGMVIDVSAQKAFEKEAQERRSELELLMRQQVAAQTTAAIAHEMNQPLVAISAYSEAAVLMLRGGAPNTEKLTAALEGAMAQSQRAGRTLHDLLEFLHRGEVPTEAVDLNHLVRDSLAVAEETGYYEFRPVLQLQPNLPPVLANRLQIEKVLVNLLRNSVEAMRNAGVPKSAITITVRTNAAGTMAQVTVQDCGPGLNADLVHRIFDPFFTTKPTGIGLGLAISRSLIEAHGGQLWADLDAGPGATFHFTLPLAP